MNTLRWMASAVLFLASLLPLAGRAAAEPALWVVKGPHATVYLFGSVHVLRKDAPWRSAKIDAAIAGSDSLWLEVTDADDPKVMQPLVMKLGVDAEHPLSTLLSKEEVAKLDGVAKQAGMAAGRDPLRPWMAALVLGLAPAMKAGFDPNSGVELTLKPEFVKAGKPLHGFETAEQQMHFFADMPQQAQIDYLKSTIEDFDTAPEKLKQMVAAWYAGDEETLDTVFSAEFRSKYPELYRTLIVRRNEGFSAHIAELAKGNGTTFVAIGAGHLVGRDGVPAMLEKMGLHAQRQ